MITIERNTVNDITVQLKKDGAPVRLTGGESLTWCLLTKQSQVIAGQQNAIDLTVAGTDLKNGKVIITVEGHANTSAATIPLALDFGVRSGKVNRGDILLFEAVGGGLTWGAVILRW